MRSDNKETSAGLEKVSDVPATPIGKETAALTSNLNKEQSEEAAKAVPQDEVNVPVTDTPPIHDNIPRLTDGRLKVQAIAWAPDAQDRMAVVNTHIVHEGHTVEGFSVITIEEDAVVVREGGQLYRVPFGRP